MTFDEVGNYLYHCVPHRFMEARVIVQDPMSEDPMELDGGTRAAEGVRVR